MLAVLAIALPLGTAYFAATQFSPSLVLLIAPLALAGLAACLVSFRSRTYRNSGVFVSTLCALLVFLIARGDRYHGDASPKDIATLAARYDRAGYTVEASKVYPAVDFYAATVIPLEQSAAHVRDKFAGAQPYIYLTRESLLQQAGLQEYKVLAGPIEFKGLILISNQNLAPPGEM
jgi:hypothetical protein